MKTQAAFTLIEIMVTVSLVIIISTFALPNLRATILGHRIATKTNQLVASVNFARNETITRTNQSFLIQSINNDWSQGWRVGFDQNNDGQLQNTADVTEIMKVFSFPTDQINVTEGTGQKQISFLARGRIPTSYKFSICNPNYQKGRLINIAWTGRASVTRCSTTVNGNLCTCQ